MDWAELNPDLLHLIVKKLGDISNFVRFRVVCKQWRLAAPTSDPPPTLPWFLEHYPSTKNKCCYRFYSLHSNKTQNLHIPQAQGTYIYHGSSRQYVQYIGNEEISCSDPFKYFKLLDPLTGSKIPMPFTESEVPIPLEFKSFELRRQYIGPGHFYNPNSILDGTEGTIAMIVGRHPTRYTSFIAMLILDGRNRTTSLEKCILQEKIIIYEPGMLVTKVLDVTTRDVVQIEQRLRLTYLLEACGDVLGVVQHFTSLDQDKILFEVYRLEHIGRTPHWVKMNAGIGDRTLFLEPTYRTGFCLNARHFDGFKGNCIYFKESNGRYDPDSITSLGRFDIEEGTTQLLPVRFHGVWFVPRL